MRTPTITEAIKLALRNPDLIWEIIQTLPCDEQVPFYLCFYICQ